MKEKEKQITSFFFFCRRKFFDSYNKPTKTIFSSKYYGYVNDLTEGGHNVITAHHLAVDSQVSLSMVITSREDGCLHIETGRWKLVAAL